jgi:Ser/Thr protein kinase RdoA (MazF antagonist)
MPLPLLNADTVARYLRDRGLAELHRGERIQVRNLSRRNHNLAVEIDGRAVWLVKQIQHNTPEVVASLAREAYCYYAAENDGPLAPLQALMPRCAYFDSEHSILVIGFLEGVSAADAHRRVGPFDERLAGKLGCVLAQVHRTPPPGSFPRELPWVLQPLDSRWRMSARSRFLAFFHADSLAGRALQNLRDSWQANTVIHGDARPENFVFSPPFEVRLVDWELANVGDADWDSANVMQHYWTQWASMGWPAPEGWNALTRALQSFWAAYDEDARPPFDRVTRFTGARLIQTAYEYSASEGGFTPLVERLVRLASLLLVQTDQALQGFEAYRAEG